MLISLLCTGYQEEFQESHDDVKARILSISQDIIAGLPRARSVRGTEPHTHGIWSTSFRLVVT